MDTTINFINAGIAAEEKGIVVEEIFSTDHRDYLNLVVVYMQTFSSEWKIAATVFGKNELRIVEINDYDVELKPEGNILIYKNVDQPGMLSSVTQKLSAAEINIASLSLGRKSEGDLALTVVNIDGRLSEAIKKSISSIDGIKDIYTVYI